MGGRAEDRRDDGLVPQDPARLRISDEERHQVAELLRTAAGEGRIDLDELEERLEATYAAKTYADLVPITADLPAQAPGSGLAPRTGSSPAPYVAPDLLGPIPTYGGSLAVMSETSRVGQWRIEDGHSAFALMGSVRLDLREATFGSADVTINASAVMGEVSVIVNATTTVVVDGIGVMGEFTEQRQKVPFEPTPGAPVVRVRGFALMASVHVQRRPMPGESRQKRLGRPRP